MEYPERDQEYPSQIWMPQPECGHPREALKWAGDFEGRTPDQWVFLVNCLFCGGSWDQTSTDPDAPWDQVRELMDAGKFDYLNRRIGPSPTQTRATAMLTRESADVFRLVSGMGREKFPIDVAVDDE